MSIQTITPMLADSALAFFLDQPVEAKQKMGEPLAAETAGLGGVDAGKKLQSHHFLRNAGVFEPDLPEVSDLTR